MTRVVDADAWLRSLPPELARQRDVIAAFLNLARADPRIRLYVVGCSIGRDAADALSDVDAGLAVRDDQWDAALAASHGWVAGAGQLVDVWQTMTPGGPPEFRESQYTYALYTSGVELDLSLWRAPDRQRPRADWIVLHDPDARVSGEQLPRTAGERDARDWSYRVLTRLAACAKYLSRGALWEAHNMVELARSDLWRLWCVAERVHDPQYGVTAVFDDPRRPVPAGFERTVAAVEARALRDAAMALLEIFLATWPRALAGVGDGDAPLPALASSVRERLRAVTT